MCRNVKEKSYLCNRRHIKRRSNRSYPIVFERQFNKLESQGQVLILPQSNFCFHFCTHNLYMVVYDNPLTQVRQKYPDDLFHVA